MKDLDGKVSFGPIHRSTVDRSFLFCVHQGDLLPNWCIPFLPIDGFFVSFFAACALNVSLFERIHAQDDVLEKGDDFDDVFFHMCGIFLLEDVLAVFVDDDDDAGAV